VKPLRDYGEGQSEEPLISDGDRYRLLVGSITDYAIYMLDANGRVTSWNPGAKRFKGYDEAEIIGEHFSRFYTDEDRQSGLPAHALATAAREGRFEHEGWRVRKDGSRMWAHVIIDPILSPAGKLIGFAKVTRDISQQRAAQQALRASEQRFRLLVQGVTDYAIYMLDREGLVASWNRGAQRFKGYAEEEIIGQHFSSFYTDEDRKSGLPERNLEVAAREGRCEQEGWRVRKDGTRMWAHVVIDPLFDDDGHLIGFAKVTRDITEQKAARETLRRSEERFRLLVQGVKDYAIYMLDPEAGSRTGTPAHSTSRATPNRRSSGSTSPASTPTRTGNPVCRPALLKRQRVRGSLSTKAGASARTARASGPT